jgi:outer membrane protein OmpA-like peptidoglycan-associated protein
LTVGKRYEMVCAMQGQTQTPQAAPARGRSRRRALLVLLALFVAFLLGLSGLTFLAMKKAASMYRDIKARVTGNERPAMTAGPAARPKALMQPCAAMLKDRAAAQRQREAAALVPLVPDLVLDHIWVYYDADIEILNRVVTVEDNEIKLTESGPLARAVNGKAVVEASTVIPIYPQCQADLASSHLLVTEGNPGLSMPLPGATRYGVSEQVYQELKALKRFPLGYRAHFYRAGAGYSWRDDYTGEMQRDILAPYKYKVIVNGTETELPALHAMGLLDGNPTQMAVLDDAANPLLLDLEIPTLRFALRTVKITYPVAKKIESDLEQAGRAEIYGIYFDFDRAVIRTESEPVLDEIAEALRKNPGWKLSIEGHTDNVGGEEHNQTLSARRAEAVKAALVERYAIAPERLTTVGFGASQPKASNATVEGRALNRRVELVKPGGSP